ncbi:MFS transporter [Reichenbachiella agarivorans]|uniref:MFS transporter n=1 Tax=Reichenbachiella agarivorans TaxID=2979464 RepID=A0ABY6CP35_9BACT|nr:MFS transporter [Reichenbachiella agarivorans]UXP32283.1 MFS transporter [Reichenbachiella agarivorans]
MNNNSIYTLQFGLLCLSGFLFFSSFNMIIPELPSHLTSMGGGDYKGLIIALFTVTAGLSRPFSGKLADKVGRVPVMIVGALVSGVAAVLYPFATTVFAFMCLRMFHGFSTGFKPTGTSAYVADIIPYNKRGEAMGVLGFFGSMGMAAGPALGPLIVKEFSLDVMFYASGFCAVLSVLILAGMKETLQPKEKLQWNHFVVKKDEIYEPKVLSPSIVMMLVVFAFGAIITVVPDISDQMKLSNRGLFYTYFTVASLVVRIVAGKASDKYGRVPVLKIGSGILLIALILLANAQTPVILLSTAVLYGIGVGLSNPTIFAWTIDLSDPKHRGRGMATMYIFLEIGVGLGALLGGWVYGNDLNNISWVFYLCAVSMCGALVYLYSKTVRNLPTYDHL